MASLWALVSLGISNPLVVDEMSTIASLSGVVVPTANCPEFVNRAVSWLFTFAVLSKKTKTHSMIACKLVFDIG